MVVLCVCLSVIKLAATYLSCKSTMQYHNVLYGVPNACIVWILPTPFCLPVMALFAVSKLLDLILRINRTLSVARYIYVHVHAVKPLRMRCRVTIIVDVALVAAFLVPWRVDMWSFRQMKLTTEGSFVCIYSYKTAGSLIGAQFNNRFAYSR